LDEGQDQDRFGQDQDLKKIVLRSRPVLTTTSMFDAVFLLIEKRI